MAFWTAAIAAGVIRVVLMVTLIALEEVATHRLCTTVEDICTGATLTG